MVRLMITITINDKIRDVKIQYDISKEAAKISTLPSGKIHKYEYLAGEEILPFNQSQLPKLAKFTYSHKQNQLKIKEEN